MNCIGESLSTLPSALDPSPLRHVAPLYPRSILSFSTHARIPCRSSEMEAIDQRSQSQCTTSNQTLAPSLRSEDAESRLGRREQPSISTKSDLFWYIAIPFLVTMVVDPI